MRRITILVGGKPELDSANAIIFRMGSRGPESDNQLIADLEQWQRRCAKSSEVFLTAAQRCCDHDPGNDTVNNLKVATILQEIALQKYQRTVDALSEQMKLDRKAPKK